MGCEAADVAEEITDEGGVADGLETIVRRYPGYSRFVGVTLDEGGNPDRETVVGAARRGRAWSAYG